MSETQTKTATLVRTGLLRGGANLYRLDPPLSYNSTERAEYVVVSAVYDDFGSGLVTHETYIFPADANGAVVDWGELPGSYRGGTDHVEALRGAGYVVAS